MITTLLMSLLSTHNHLPIQTHKTPVFLLSLIRGDSGPMYLGFIPWHLGFYKVARDTLLQVTLKSVIFWAHVYFYNALKMSLGLVPEVNHDGIKFELLSMYPSPFHLLAYFPVARVFF